MSYGSLASRKLTASWASTLVLSTLCTSVWASRVFNIIEQENGYDQNASNAWGFVKSIFGSAGRKTDERLLYRKWIEAGVTTSAKPALVVMQFNVLADGPAQGQFARKFNAPGGADLYFPQRFEQGLSEILRVDPDLLFMEEVNHYDDFWSKKLREVGYDGMFLPKFSDSYNRHKKPPAYFQGQSSDGILLYIKTAKFKLGRNISNRFAEILDPSMSQGLMAAEILDATSGVRLFTASVSHLKSGGKKTDIKMRKRQCGSWIKVLQEFGEPPFILAGDMNEDLYGANKFQAVRSLQRDLQLIDAYPQLNYTAMDGKWKSAVDYILISDAFRVHSYFEIPDLPDDSLPAGGLSRAYPSDHLSIAAKLIWARDAQSDDEGNDDAPAQAAGTQAAGTQNWGGNASEGQSDVGSGNADLGDNEAADPGDQAVETRLDDQSDLSDGEGSQMGQALEAGSQRLRGKDKWRPRASARGSRASRGSARGNRGTARGNRGSARGNKGSRRKAGSQRKGSGRRQTGSTRSRV